MSPKSHPFALAELGAVVEDVALRVAEFSGTALSFDEKGESHFPPNLVTEKDRETETILFERLAKLDPKAEFWSEETRVDRPDSDRFFVVDPIDGTNNFLNGLPLFALNVGYVADGRIRAAATVVPALGMLFLASEGNGATCNGRPIQVGHRSLRMSILGVGIQPRNWHLVAGLNFDRAFRSVRSVRVLGSMAVELAWVASGRLDLWFGGGHAWDVWPGRLLIEEAGGRFHELIRAEDNRNGHSVAIAGAPESIEALIRVLSV